MKLCAFCCLSLIKCNLGFLGVFWFSISPQETRSHSYNFNLVFPNRAFAFLILKRSISSLERAPMFYNTCQLNCRVSWVKKALLLAVSKYYKRNSSHSQIVSCPDFYNLHLLAQYSFSSKKCHGYLVENNCKDFGYCSCVLVIELRDLREERIVRKLFRSRKRCFWEDRWRTRRYVCFYVLGSTTGVFEPAFAVLCFLRG